MYICWAYMKNMLCKNICYSYYTVTVIVCIFATAAWCEHIAV